MRMLWVAMVLLGALRAGAADAPTCDIDTDEKLAKLIERIHGHAIPVEHRCVQRSKTFPGLVLAGQPRLEYGCNFDFQVYDCAQLTNDGSAVAMKRAGWAKADAATRAKLAWAWLADARRVVLLTTAPPLVTQNAKHKFEPPRVEATPDGGLKLRFWWVPGPDSEHVEEYRLGEVVVAPSGAVGPTEYLENVEVEP